MGAETAPWESWIYYLKSLHKCTRETILDLLSATVLGLSKTMAVDGSHYDLVTWITLLGICLYIYFYTRLFVFKKNEIHHKMKTIQEKKTHNSVEFEWLVRDADNFFCKQLEYDQINRNSGRSYGKYGKRKVTSSILRNDFSSSLFHFF